MLAQIGEWGRHASVMGAAWFGSAQVTSWLANASDSIETSLNLPGGGTGIFSVIILALYGAWQYEIKKARTREADLQTKHAEEMANLKAEHRTSIAVIEESRKEAWKITEQARIARNEAQNRCRDCPGNELRRKSFSGKQDPAQD